MGIIYLVASIAVALMAPVIYKAGLRNIALWKTRDSGWQLAVLSLASSLLLVTALAWLYLVLITLGSWLAALDASRPRPAFLLPWLIGFFIYGFGISFVGNLHALSMRNYEK